jgi:hypothetical protein
VMWLELGSGPFGSYSAIGRLRRWSLGEVRVDSLSSPAGLGMAGSEEG